jgi:hypothetical protein
MAQSMVSYEIPVGGLLGETIRSAFPDLRARARDRDTILSGVLADQAALYGVLAQVGLELIEVRRLPPASRRNHPNGVRPAHPGAGQCAITARHPPRCQSKRATLSMYKSAPCACSSHRAGALSVSASRPTGH